MYGNGFAALYESHFNHWIRSFAPELASYLLAQLEPGRRVLDLCCGTGETARSLCSVGWRVIGVDRSTDMLAIAADKLRSELKEGRAELFEGDAERFQLSHKADACVCIDGALNHLPTLEALQSCFYNVSQSIVDGALFVFDLLEADHFSQWANSVTMVDDKDVMYVRRGSWDPQHNVARLQISGVLGPGPVGWRIRETLISRTFTHAEVTDALTMAGLVEVTCTLEDRRATGRTVRCAVKPSNLESTAAD
ncbi:methyltransferase domain-containing protein [Neorhizobium sp. BETTINA12A]|uniref:class I SAM-dependent DNA methyltransferase n=1 Tax=Neorhizobium sp. BETTINA12A TaxID=2908924 RepID=UPI001FF2919F|nr:class I SAM-dependent methyltransferase [Neorhizobium sp. BETTINA12A]MCJ9750394.1 methyltransferase domain-containing protein [Neorhizobium sp. BETTINA12A]